MPVSLNQFGLPSTEDQNKLGATGGANIATGGAVSPDQPQQSAFGTVTPGQITAAAAAPVAPPVTNFAFNEKYAAQNQGLEQLLADKAMERQNQITAAQESYGRNVSDAGRTRDKALEALINKYATSGMIGSGIDARSRTDLEGDFNRYLGDLEIALGNAKQGIEGNWANTIRGVNQQRTQMWGQQRADEEAARQLAEQRRLDAEKAQRDADAARQAAEDQRLMREALANQPPPVINMGGISGGGVTGSGGGGGGGGGYAANDPINAPAGFTAAYAGIAPTDSSLDIINQIQVLQGQRNMDAMTKMYSEPWMQQPFWAPIKKQIGQWIYGASTPGTPGYIPSSGGGAGGFY